VHINLVISRIKPAPHLYAGGDKERVDPPVMGRQNRFLDAAGGPSSACHFAKALIF
jgi:hypothetical protein